MQTGNHSPPTHNFPKQSKDVFHLITTTTPAANRESAAACLPQIKSACVAPSSSRPANPTFGHSFLHHPFQSVLSPEMRPTKLLSFCFATLAVGVAVPEFKAATTEAAVTTVHTNACLKTCPVGSRCGYCGFSGRYSIECCKRDTSPGQLRKVDALIPEAVVRGAPMSTLEAAAVVARDNTETHHVSHSTAYSRILICSHD
jgi:hypothetical protein